MERVLLQFLDHAWMVLVVFLLYYSHRILLSWIEKNEKRKLEIVRNKHEKEIKQIDHTESKIVSLSKENNIQRFKIYTLRFIKDDDDPVLVKDFLKCWSDDLNIHIDLESGNVPKKDIVRTIKRKILDLK